MTQVRHVADEGSTINCEFSPWACGGHVQKKRAIRSAQAFELRRSVGGTMAVFPEPELVDARREGFPKKSRSINLRDGDLNARQIFVSSEEPRRPLIETLFVAKNVPHRDTLRPSEPSVRNTRASRQSLIFLAASLQQAPPPSGGGLLLASSCPSFPLLPA
jgi:hypothetical protein